MNEVIADGPARCATRGGEGPALRERAWPYSPLCEPESDPLFWPPELPGTESAWWGHVPFAHWLIAAARPRLLVELGTHRAVSYSAFCQAVQRLGLETRCFAIDTWEGDPHAGTYDEDVFRQVDTYNTARFGAFSTLLRCRFDDAVDGFEDGSIDLLHIDGYHTYQAVRHDFETWLPKLSECAVVLFHDIEVRRDGFGVWQLWNELRTHHPNFEFLHGHGLGILAIGARLPQPIAHLCGLPGPERARFRERAATLGARWIAEMRLGQAARAASESAEARARLEAELARRQSEIDAAGLELARARQALAEAHRELAETRAEVAEVRSESEARTASLVDINARLGCMQAEAAQTAEKLVAADADRAELRRAYRFAEQARLQAEHELSASRASLEAVLSSTAWKSMTPLRAFGAKLPPLLRRMIRRFVRAFGAAPARPGL